jgi:hypothetical protein
MCTVTEGKIKLKNFGTFFFFFLLYSRGSGMRTLVSILYVAGDIGLNVSIYAGSTGSIYAGDVGLYLCQGWSKSMLGTLLYLSWGVGCWWRWSLVTIYDNYFYTVSFICWGEGFT